MFRNNTNLVSKKKYNEKYCKCIVACSVSFSKEESKLNSRFLSYIFGYVSKNLLLKCQFDTKMNFAYFLHFCKP